MANREPSTDLPTSWTLLRSAVGRNPLAWQSISFLYAPLVYDWLRMFGTSSQDAPDVCQEVFKRVFEHLPAFQQDGGHFRKWLWTITKNKAIDFYRQNKKRPATVSADHWDRLEASLTTTPEPLDASDTRLPIGVLERAMNLARQEFEPKTWHMAEEAIMGDGNAADIAGAYGVSVGAVYQAKSRVRAVLRGILSGLES